jgi:hypothetical protein
MATGAENGRRTCFAGTVQGKIINAGMAGGAAVIAMNGNCKAGVKNGIGMA